MAARVSHIKSWGRTAEHIHAGFWTSACGAGQSCLAPASSAVPISFWCWWQQILQFGCWCHCCCQMSVGFLFCSHVEALQFQTEVPSWSLLTWRLFLLWVLLCTVFGQWRLVVLPPPSGCSLKLIAFCYRAHTHLSGWHKLTFKAVLRKGISSSQVVFVVFFSSQEVHGGILPSLSFLWACIIVASVYFFFLVIALYKCLDDYPFLTLLYDCSTSRI